MTTIVEEMQAATDALNGNAQQYFAMEQAVVAAERLVITETGADLTGAADQLMRAIRGGLLSTFTDVDAVNALRIIPRTPHTAPFKGMPFRIFPAYTNTGAATLSVGAAGLAGTITAPLCRRDGTPAQNGDLPALAPVDVAYDGVSAFRMLSVAQAEVQRLVTNPIIYVRPDGNDLNDGSANDAGHAFKTIAAAVARGTSRFALVGSVLTIQLGMVGSYDHPGAIPATAGTVIIQGDMANQDNYVLTGVGSSGGGTACTLAVGGTLQLRGLKLQNTGAINHTLAGTQGGFVSCYAVTFETTGNNTGFGHTYAGTSGGVNIYGGCKFIGSMGAAFFATAGGSVALAPVAITFVGTPNFALATARAALAGSILVTSGASFVGSGVTGPRYLLDLNAVINTAGAGANFFPGNTAGSTATGGQYV